MQVDDRIIALSKHHSLRSLLAYNQFDSKKHSGIIAYFNQHYVKTEKLSNELSVI